MATDDRDVLELLKSELAFVENGGYSHSAATHWRPSSIFQDSPTCLNFCKPNRTSRCQDCLLTTLVPSARLAEEIPCHFIPLNADGETIHYLENNEPPEVVEQRVTQWLRRMIAVLEAARAEPVTSVAH
jgi:hypothetical protein